MGLSSHKICGRFGNMLAQREVNPVTNYDLKEDTRGSRFANRSLNPWKYQFRNRALAGGLSRTGRIEGNCLIAGKCSARDKE